VQRFAFKLYLWYKESLKQNFMRRLILYFSLLLFTFSAGAQIVVNPDSLVVSASQDTADFAAAFEVTNNNATTATFWWKLEVDEDFPKEWKFQVCDANTCYFDGFAQCPPNNPNVIESGVTNSNYSVKIKPNGVAGTTLVYFNIYNDSDCTDLLLSLPINLQVGTSGLIHAEILQDLTIYPNPTVDKFMVNNTKSLNRMEIYNIAGKKMKSFKVVTGQEYHVEELKNGLYLVRMLDRNDKVLKVIRLSKK
jgi:hypothetical protein